MADLDHIRTILLRIEEQSSSGFAIAFHIRFTTPEFLIQTYPPDWTNLYSERGYVMGDPTVRWGFENTGVKRWSDLSGDDPMGIFEESAKFGLVHGMTVATEADGSRSVASFARADREFADEEIAELEGLVATLHRETATKDGMDPKLRDELHRMSVKMTHPPARKS